MNLKGLLPLLRSLDAYNALVEELAGRRQRDALSSRRRLVLGLTEPARPYVLAALHRDIGRPLVLLLSSVEKARRYYEELRQWSDSPDDVLLFREPDALPYEREPWSRDTISQRMEVLSRLALYFTPMHRSIAQGRPPLVVASARSLLYKTMPRTQLLAGMRLIRVGQERPLHKFLRFLVDLGYRNGSVVDEPGTFSRRGGIVDIYPPASRWPVRLEFFGNQIETIRYFHPGTQRSLDKTDCFLLTPATEAIPSLGPEAAERFVAFDTSTCHPPAQGRFQEDMEKLRRGVAFRGIEFYIPLLYLAPGSLFDYIPDEAVVLVEDPEELVIALENLSAQLPDIEREMVKSGEVPEGLPEPYLPWQEIRQRLENRVDVLLGWPWGERPGDKSPIGEAFTPAPLYAGQLERVLDEARIMQNAGTRVVLVTRQAHRLAEMLKERGEPIELVQEVTELPPLASLTLVRGILSGGWMLRTADETTVLLTDAEIFGWSRPAPRRPARTHPRAPESFFADLKPGDYVVHIEHGIGIFRGLVKLEMHGVEREYLLVEYAAGDKLYVPVHQADRLSRYVGIDGQPPVIHRLGTADWERAKERARRAIADIARDLLQLYTAREVVTGHAFSPDTPWQAELEASFPYEETPDQLKALEEVKRDMEQPRPMDRLICGDVGYGKTEVALRAAFKAVMDGKQVALLVPTTILAQQHYETFRERLKPFPVVVEMLSRFRSPAEQRRIIEGLKKGTVDIVIGTHRLLQKDVAFKDLGLVIIDEEQRFGVAHKEYLKKLRTQVDVLTLTATPIPRTLYMSLTGVRDMSTIETPPEERLPVKVYVGPYDETLVRQAILRELNRGGQVYFVHNRVNGIRGVADRVKKLVPEARVEVAHGRLPEEKLAQVMLDFAAGKIDILVCTSIIESGLDIPNANTIIINRADMFGLAQLYQLRGRVGRGAVRAYAYFLYDPQTPLNEAARRRLEAMMEAGELGAGFRIAMKDLEIRGAGEILGPRQHGHIAAIGFDLYCRLLARAVQELREGEEAAKAALLSLPDVTIDLPLPSYIPDGYVSDPFLRLQLYRRMANLRTLEQIEEMRAELEDRFGPLPVAVRYLLYQLRIKVLALKAGVSSIGVEDGQIVIRVDPKKIKGDELRKRLGKEVRPGRRAIWLPMLKREQWQKLLEKALEELGRLQ
ncbi:MAG TPA: transcription-repair coupling factor [Chloroflexi bacterium]|nr:transcription-repair coupling factor [Chloroflexota bacterium]